MVVAVYAGSFDPVTNGHVDLIQRGAGLFERLIVAVATNAEKRALFLAEERMAMLRGAVAVSNVEVDCFEGLVVEYARKRGARVLLRGVRSVADYEYERQMALMNKRLAPDLETVCLMADEGFSFVSSRLVKEVGGLGGDISGMVPADVEHLVGAKLKIGAKLKMRMDLRENS